MRHIGLWWMKKEKEKIELKKKQKTEKSFTQENVLWTMTKKNGFLVSSLTIFVELYIIIFFDNSIVENRERHL